MEPRSHFESRLSLIVRVNVILNGTVFVDSDWRFDNLLCSSCLQSQSELYHVSWWYYSLVIDLIGQLHRDVIGRLSVKPWFYWLWRLNQLMWYNSLWLWRWLLPRLSKCQSLSTTTVLFRTYVHPNDQTQPNNWPFLDVVRMEVYNEWRYIIYIIDCWYDQSGIFQRTWESQTLQSIP